MLKPGGIDDYRLCTSFKNIFKIFYFGPKSTPIQPLIRRRDYQTFATLNEKKAVTFSPYYKISVTFSYAVFLHIDIKMD